MRVEDQAIVASRLGDSLKTNCRQQSILSTPSRRCGITSGKGLLRPLASR